MIKDPSIPDPRERKKLMFYDTGKRQTDLRIRLRYDGMNQSHFFRVMITGYLEKNELIMEYLDSYKKEHQIQAVPKRNKSMKLLEKGKKNEKDFGLTDIDVESIFDIIAEEHPDL
jgi:hypothetical protein